MSQGIQSTIESVKSRIRSTLANVKTRTGMKGQVGEKILGGKLLEGLGNGQFMQKIKSMRPKIFGQSEEIEVEGGRRTTAKPTKNLQVSD